MYLPVKPNAPVTTSSSESVIHQTVSEEHWVNGEP